MVQPLRPAHEQNVSLIRLRNILPSPFQDRRLVVPPIPVTRRKPAAQRKAEIEDLPYQGPPEDLLCKRREATAQIAKAVGGRALAGLAQMPGHSIGQRF